MAISLNNLSPLPTPPAKTDPANFAQRADDFLATLPGLVAEANAMIAELNKLTSGLDQATPIAAWSAGTTYNFPDVVAGSDGYSYRCIDTGVTGVDPVGDTSAKWVNLSVARSVGVPDGAIIPYLPGYFTDADNGGFVNTVGSVAEINALYNSAGLWVCNGAMLNVPGSATYDGSGRYLPNMTDDRFLMGASVAGEGGGANSISHKHSYDHYHTTSPVTLTSAQIGIHRHRKHPSTWMDAGPANNNLNQSIYFDRHGPTGGNYITKAGDSSTLSRSLEFYDEYEGGGQPHGHGNTSSVTAVYGSAWTSTSVFDNRPRFMGCYFLRKVK